MHPLNGSWIADVAHSRRDPNHQFSRATMRFEIADDRVSLSYGGVNANGRHEQGVHILLADGHERPVPEAPGVVASCALTPRALQTVGTKDGAVVGRALYEVADDGRSMTATVSGLDASGKSFDQVIVFDRE